MADYSTQIAGLKAAIASGVTEVNYKDYSAKFDSFEKMLARLRFLEDLQGTGAARAVAGLSQFSRGDS